MINHNLARLQLSSNIQLRWETESHNGPDKLLFPLSRWFTINQSWWFTINQSNWFCCRQSVNSLGDGSDIESLINVVLLQLIIIHVVTSCSYSLDPSITTYHCM